MKHIDIYTDGACSGNPGVGGWAAILRYAGVEKVLVGREEFTTNNRMELTAVIEALKALREPCDVVVTTDSKYVVDAVNLNWLENWKSKGWRKSNNKQLPNIELWKQFDALLSVHNVKFKWIKGHAGFPENERCDALAVLQYSK